MNGQQELIRILNDILRRLGKIEGELIGIGKLSERVSKLEVWQSRLKGAWAAVVAGYVYLCRISFGK